MKILIPILSFGKSGGMKVISNLANHWIGQGHQVTIVSANKEKPYYLTDADIIYMDSCNGSKLGSLKSLYCLFLFIKKNLNNFDFVIANYNLTAYPVFFAAKNKGFYYIQAYEPDFFVGKKNKIKGYILRLLAWLTYFLPLHKVVNSNMYMDYKNIKAKDVVFPGMNLNIFSPKKRSNKKNIEIFKVGCIGREEKYKGSEDVAEAIKILHSKGYKNIDFIVAFKSVSYPRHRLVMPDGDKKLAEFYQSLDILVTPGHIQLDAIHYPVIEAMATKTPLITTGYYPASDTNSFLVSVQSPADIADKIEFIINNYEEAILKAELAYEHIQNLSWENTSSKFLKILMDKI